jgi:serine phosphatase RsbU (regulator of sigma subunit)
MFVTEGPLDPESDLFVGRRPELKRMDAWLQNVNCVGAVLGARQTGKTSLLLKLRHMAQAKYAFAYVDFQAVQGADTSECFSYLAEELVAQLADTTGSATLPSPRTSKDFLAFLRDLAAASRSVRIGVLLDEVGGLPPPTAIKFAAAIRSAFTNRLVKREYAKYVFLLAGASDVLELTTGRNSPLRNVTESIYLGDLSLAETGEVLTRATEGPSMRVDPAIQQSVYDWTSGHPYWTQLLGSVLNENREPPTTGHVDRIVNEILRTEDRNLPPTFRFLAAEEALWRLMEHLLDGAPIPFSRANSAVARLELIGVLKNEDGRCSIRNRIYREAIQRLQLRQVRAPEASLRILARRIFAASDTERLLHEVVEHVQQWMQNRSAVAFMRSPDGSMTPVAHLGVSPDVLRGTSFEPVSRLLTVPDPVFDPLAMDLPEGDRAKLAKIGCARVVPLRVRDQALGMLSLGPKLSDANFDAQDLEVLQSVAEQSAAAIERIQLRGLEHDAERARQVQRDLLPKSLEQLVGFEIAGMWRPARLVSGDYHDVLRLSEGRLALGIGDVVGKGMPAALLMANLQAAVKAFAPGRSDPGEVCAEVNRLICANIAIGRFITFFYGVLDSETGRLVYTNAGHNPPILLRRSGEESRLEIGGMVLGISPDEEYERGEVALSSGDVLLLFTDGVSEARNQSGEEYGEERLTHLLRNHTRANAAEMQRIVMEAVSEFARGDFHDDVTLLVVRVADVPS